MSYMWRYKFSLIIAAAIVYLSLMKPPSFDSKLFDIENIDKIIHAIMYATLSAVMAVETKTEKILIKTIPIFIISTIFGGVIEILQNFTPPRSASWGDFLADAIGSALPLVILTLIYIFSYERHGKSSTNCAKPYRRNRAGKS